MGTSLSGKKISNTYQSIIKISDNTEAAATAKQLSDGNGNDLGIYVDTDGVFGIGSAASYSLDISSQTDGISLPVGTSANRPTPAAGLIRYNSTIGKVEFYDSDWRTVFTTSGGTISGNVTITGDLTIQGNNTIIEAQTVEVEDNILNLNRTQGTPDTATATTSGISIYRGDGVNEASFIFDDSDDTWDLTNNLNIAGNLTVDTSTLFVDAANNWVGVGTNSPSSKLEVVGGASHGTGFTQTRSGHSSFSLLNGGTNSVYLGIAPDGGSYNTFMQVVEDGTDINYLRFNTGAGTERLRIDASGNVGIGVTSMSEKLEVNGAIVWEGALTTSQTSAGVLDRSGNDLRIRAYGATAGTGNLVFRTGGGGGSVDSEVMRIDGSGRVGINKTTPTVELDVNGDIKGTNITGNLSATSTLADGVTATTQTEGDNSTKIATTAYVDASIKTTEEIQDVVGAMVSGNTETNITVTYDDTNGKLNFVANAGDITGVTAGTGLSGGGTSGAVTLNVDLSELTDMTAAMVGTDEFIVLDAGADRRKAASEIGLSIFNNDAGFTTNVGDITGVTAGTGLSGGGTSGAVTLSLDGTGTVGAGTYGSTSNSVKIDNITVDAYGRITAVTTGTVGDITAVTLNADTGSATDVSSTAEFTIAGGTNVTTSASGTTITIDAASGATYTAGAGIDIDGSNVISVESDLTNDVVTFGEDSSNYMTIQSWTGHRFITNGAEKMRLELDGDLHADGDVVAYSTTVSDERLKDDVKTIDNALETVEKLRGVSYVWNKGKRQGKKDIGLIAQEVEKVIPEIVHDKKMPLIDDEVYKTIDYEKLVGVLIESVKELSAEVKDLKNIING